MPPIYSDHINDASAWTPASLGGKEGLVRTLEGAQLTAIDQLLAALKGTPTEAITRQDFEHPALTPFLAARRDDIMNGPCVVIIRGIDTGRYALEDCERLFWGFGTHWGKAAVQSARADRIGYVAHEPDDPIKRGYRSARELVLHTDSRAIIALMSIQTAESGGYTRLASATTIHNLIRRERPDLLAALYRGYYYLSSELGLSPSKIPVFSSRDGVVSCAFFEAFMRNAAKKKGEALPPDLDEALTYFAQVAARDDVHLQFMLEPGEIMVCNNFVVLHARTEFQNSEERQRFLIRLWLNVSDGRWMVPEFLQRSQAFDKNHDPQYVESA